MFGRLSRVLVWLRWVLAPAWVALAVTAWLYLPQLPSSGSLSLTSVVPANSPAVRVQEQALGRFGLPLLSRTSVVLRDPRGLSAAETVQLLQAAAATADGKAPNFPDLLAAVPVTNQGRLVPSARESGTTAVVYLFFRPGTDPGRRTSSAEEFARQYLRTPPGGTLGIVGPFAAERAQGNLISHALPIVEIGTVVVVILVVGLRFRSPVAPVVALLAAGISFVLTTRVLGWLAVRHGFAVPGALEPLLVVLLVGVVTDYAVFLLAGYQQQLGRGVLPREAMVRAGRDILPIVVTAGVAVAAGTASLLVAQTQLFGRLGPGMAITVLITMVVAATFVPALVALLGRAALWPSREGRRRAPRPRGTRGVREAVLRVLVRRWAAVLVLLLGAGLVAVGSVPLARYRMGANVVSDLPSSAAPARALAAVSRGFAPGIVAPTELVLSGPGIAQQREGLVDLQHALGSAPGVAGVIGPEQQPFRNRLGVVYAPSGNAARFLVLLADAPYGARAVGDVDSLEHRLPELLSSSGLRPTRVGWTGDTVLSAEVVQQAQSDLVRVGCVALGVLLIVLIGFLRSLVTPLFLLLASAAVVTVALGTTYWLFSSLTAVSGPTFFMPLAVAVLLLAFGSDYNILLVGRIRELSAQLPWRDAVVAGGAQAARAIASAGLALAGSFAMLALVPLDAFRQFAFAMVLGILLDTFVVRAVLVPSGLALLGRWAGWPGRRLGRGADD